MQGRYLSMINQILSTSGNATGESFNSLKDVNRLKSLEYYLALKKRRKSCHYDDIDGPGRHYAK